MLWIKPMAWAWYSNALVMSYFPVSFRCCREGLIMHPRSPLNLLGSLGWSDLPPPPQCSIIGIGHSNNLQIYFYKTKPNRKTSLLLLSICQFRLRGLFKFTNYLTFLGHTVSFDFKLMAHFFLFFYYSYVHTRLGSFLPPAPTPSLTTHSAPFLSPHPLNTQQKLFCPYL
jgi:hypothetical protein